MMKLNRPLLLLILFSATARGQEDNCVFNFANYQSPLDAKAAAYKSLEKANKDMSRRLLTQTAVLKNGVKLDFSSGGCAHHSFTYTFNQTRGVEGKSDFDRAIHLLNKAPDNEGNARLLIGALEDARRKNVKKSAQGTYDLPCGDATCILDVSQKNRVQLTYDFAL